MNEKAAWHKVLAEHEEANFLQTPEWAEVYEMTGDRPVLYMTEAGIALCIIKDARRGRYMEIPGGPLIDWGQMAKFFAGLKKLAAAEGCVFIRMRPQLLDTAENRKKLGEVGAKMAPMHLHAQNTVMIDLGKSEEALLAAMRRQTRYEVRRAEKMGVRVKEGASEEMITRFCEMQAATARRQGFVPPEEAFIRAEFKAFRDKIKLYRAEYVGEIVAMAIVIMAGEEADYVEAASAERAREVPAAYALQWRIIRDMKKMGMGRYNMFGVAPAGMKHHRYAGVATFKTGFGGERVDYMPAMDIIVRRFKYWPSFILETVRRKRRHL
jgi:lipid II:glycine glycyltransferase (peptidoglycan interpeptide bridge formation enzyme)